LNKSLVESLDAKPEDRLIIMQDTENFKITIRFKEGIK